MIIRKECVVNEDPALTLKKMRDRGEAVGEKDAAGYLERSPLMEKFLSEPEPDTRLFTGLRALEWRLLELSEIPFTGSLKKVRDWLDILMEKTRIPEGFSLTGERDGVLSYCFNHSDCSQTVSG